MTNSQPNQNLSTPYEGKTCYRCGINGGTKKFSFVIRYSYRVKLCFPCIEALHGSAEALQWLEQNCKFNKTGKIVKITGEEF